jgi:hypothetical protein
MEYYKGERIADLLATIEVMEKRLKALTGGNNTDNPDNPDNPNYQPFSLAQYEEVAQGYTSLALAKAKFKALQGEK